MLSSLEYLTEHEWKCTYDNIIALRNSTRDTDSQVITLFICIIKSRLMFKFFFLDFLF
jgi:hypothetical protein